MHVLSVTIQAKIHVAEARGINPYPSKGLGLQPRQFPACLSQNPVNLNAGSVDWLKILGHTAAMEKISVELGRLMSVHFTAEIIYISIFVAFRRLQKTHMLCGTFKHSSRVLL